MGTASLNHRASLDMRAAFRPLNAYKEAVVVVNVYAVRADFCAADRALVVKGGFVVDSLNIGRVVICESSEARTTGGQSLDIIEKVGHVDSGSDCGRLQPIVADRVHGVNG